MKQTILTIIMLTVGITHTFSQSFEIGLHTGTGKSDNSFNSNSGWIQNETHLNFTPIELSLNYRLKTNKKIKPFIGSGLKVIKNKYQHNIESLEFDYNVKSLYFLQNHISAPIRVGIDWEVFGQNSIGFQYELQYNVATSNEEILQGDGAAIFGSLSYTYKLTNRTKNYISHTVSMYVRTKITNNLYLNSSIGYGIIPITGDYDFVTEQLQTNTNQDTGEQTQISSSYKIKEEDISNNLVVLKIGISREF